MLAALAISALAQEPEEAAIPASDPAAEQIMIRAHQARADWDEMPGFKAKLFVAEDGQEFAGEVFITRDGEVGLDLPDALDDAWVDDRLQSLFLHRQARIGGFNVSFADDVAQHPLGRLIRINDDRAMGSRYRVDGDLIREVHRDMGQTLFTITVTDVFRNAENKYLPKSYFLAYWDAESGDLTSTLTAFDEWVRVGRWDLPARLLSIESDDSGRRRVREIRLEDHQLETDVQTAGP